jgi:hypothetical protein
MHDTTIGCALNPVSSCTVTFVHGSLVNGVLVDGDLQTISAQRNGIEERVPTFCQVPTYVTVLILWVAWNSLSILVLSTQVRVPKAGLKKCRVLAPKDLFEAIELCLGPARERGKTLLRHLVLI